MLRIPWSIRKRNNENQTNRYASHTKKSKREISRMTTRCDNTRLLLYAAPLAGAHIIAQTWVLCYEWMIAKWLTMYRKELIDRRDYWRCDKVIPLQDLIVEWRLQYEPCIYFSGVLFCFLAFIGLMAKKPLFLLIHLIYTFLTMIILIGRIIMNFKSDMLETMSVFFLFQLSTLITVARATVAQFKYYKIKFLVDRAEKRDAKRKREEIRRRIKKGEKRLLNQLSIINRKIEDLKVKDNLNGSSSSMSFTKSSDNNVKGNRRARARLRLQKRVRLVHLQINIERHTTLIDINDLMALGAALASVFVSTRLYAETQLAYSKFILETSCDLVSDAATINRWGELVSHVPNYSFQNSFFGMVEVCIENLFANHVVMSILSVFGILMDSPGFLYTSIMALPVIVTLQILQHFGYMFTDSSGLNTHESGMHVIAFYICTYVILRTKFIRMQQKEKELKMDKMLNIVRRTLSVTQNVTKKFPNMITKKNKQSLKSKTTNRETECQGDKSAVLIS